MKKSIVIAVLLVSTCMGYSQEELAVFNTPIEKKGMSEKKECWMVCKRKISQLQQIQKALDFYKKSSSYSFVSSIKRSK
jgi:hypothetical protein